MAILLAAAFLLAAAGAVGLIWWRGRAPRSKSAQIIDTVTHELPRVHEVRRLLKLITRALIRTVQARQVTIYLYEPQTATYWLAASHGSDGPPAISQLDETSPVVQWLRERRRPLHRPEALAAGRRASASPSDPYRRLHFILENLRAALVIPSLQGRRLVGFIVLGPRQDARAYSAEELAAVQQLAREGAVALDNTRRYEQWKTTAQKLQSTQAQLLRQERMVAAGRLAMGLAHEIKNPLAAIKTFSEFLPERFEDPVFRRECARVIRTEVDRISRIVQSLADFAKPILLKIETIEIQRVLRDTVTLLSNDCLKRNVTVAHELDPEPLLLPGDPNQLKQVFLNLCMNALEAMAPKGGGTLTVRCHLDQGEAIIAVADTGTGIEAEHLPHLFDPFYTTKDSGMGLGLAVVKQIIEQHLGTIRVESQVGTGSTFEVRLPLAVRFRPSQTPTGSHAVHERPEPLVRTSLDLLVVDDEPKIQTLLKESFAAIGARVRVAASGEEALELISQAVPQLVLLDLKLQAMDGFEVLRHLKLRYPALPAIVITGAYDETIDRHVKDLGALACFHKPIELSRLQRAVGEFAAQVSAHP